MSESPSPAPAGPVLTVPEAAARLGVPERTLRRWVTSGKIPSEPDPSLPRSRLLRPEVLEEWRAARSLGGAAPAAAAPDPGADRRPVDPAARSSVIGQEPAPPSFARPISAAPGQVIGHLGGQRPEERPSVIGQRARITIKGVTHGLSADAAAARAEAAEQERGQLARERDRLAEEVRFLRAQVHHAQAAGEVHFLRERLQQAHEAEQQLRILLGQAQRTIQDLAQRPALPPAEEGGEQPRRVRWWQPWRRG